jgi:hypothetical protein
MKLLIQGLIGFFVLNVLGYYPALAVGTTAVIIVLLFLFFGKE